MSTRAAVRCARGVGLRQPRVSDGVCVGGRGAFAASEAREQTQTRMWSARDALASTVAGRRTGSAGYFCRCGGTYSATAGAGGAGPGGRAHGTQSQTDRPDYNDATPGNSTELNQKPKVCIMQAAVVLSCPGRGAWGRPGARAHLRTADMGRADPALSAQTGDSRAARAQHPTLARAHQKPNSAHPNTWHPNWCALPQGSPRVSLRACVRRATQSIKYA